MPFDPPPRTPVPRLRIGRSDGSVRSLIEKSRRHNRSEALSSGSSSDESDDLRYSPRRRRRGRGSSERKVQIIRDAFRHVCRDPTSKTHTLSEMRLEFGRRRDGVMSVPAAAFRAALLPSISSTYPVT